MKYFIYCLTNKTNYKSYIGQTKNIEKRWKNHLYDAFRIKNPHKTYDRKYAIHNAIALYGKDNFIWQVIDEFEDIDSVNEAEEFYISYINTFAPSGYNLTTGGGNKILSQSTKDKLRAKLKIVGSFVGKKGKDHPNFGTKRSAADNLKQSIARSGDGSSVKKINSKIAREIYLEYVNNENIFPIQLGAKYGLKKGAIINILNKKCWKEATKDLPNIVLKERTRGEKWIKSKLTEKDVIEIIEKYKSGNNSIKKLAIEYNMSSTGAISNIINNKSWKHIPR